VKRYEGLFILNTAGKEEGIKEMIEKVAAEITAAGAKILNTQKMEKRAFARVRDRRHSSGFYVNFIFDATPAVVAGLRTRFTLNEDVFRTLFTLAPAAKPPTA
jgi:ribosomal protein S6